MGRAFLQPPSGGSTFGGVLCKLRFASLPLGLVVSSMHTPALQFRTF